METGGQEGELSHSSLHVTGRIVNYRPWPYCQEESIISYRPPEERRYVHFLQETGSPATQLRGSRRLSELLSPMECKVKITFLCREVNVCIISWAAAQTHSVSPILYFPRVLEERVKWLPYLTSHVASELFCRGQPGPSWGAGPTLPLLAGSWLVLLCDVGSKHVCHVYF